MAVYIYHRCSTDSQQFAQQQKCVKDYMLRMGISDDMIEEVVTEKVSGTVKHTDRRLFGLLNKCQNGDTVLVSELSRLGRNMTDLFEIVTKACEMGIRLIQCKDGNGAGKIVCAAKTAARLKIVPSVAKRCFSHCLWRQKSKLPISGSVPRWELMS